MSDQLFIDNVFYLTGEVSKITGVPKDTLYFYDKVGLLNEYKDKALRLATYYKKVAEDISWYESQNEKMKQIKYSDKIVVKQLKERTVIIGNENRDETSYHANLQEASKDVISNTSSIKRQYGYVLDINEARKNQFHRKREYLTMGENALSDVAPSNIYTIPSGKYAVCTIEIHGKYVDFSHLFQWIDSNGYKTDAIYADEVGLQLFEYFDFYCEIKAHLI